MPFTAIVSGLATLGLVLVLGFSIACDAAKGRIAMEGGAVHLIRQHSSATDSRPIFDGRARLSPSQRNGTVAAAVSR